MGTTYFGGAPSDPGGYAFFQHSECGTENLLVDRYGQITLNAAAGSNLKLELNSCYLYNSPSPTAC